MLFFLIKSCQINTDMFTTKILYLTQQKWASRNTIGTRHLRCMKTRLELLNVMHQVKILLAVTNGGIYNTERVIT